MRVLHARAGALEREFAFGVVRRLIEPALTAAGPRRRRALLGGAAGGATATLSLEPPASALDEQRVLHGLYWVCSNLAERVGLLIAVDDAHWADARVAALGGLHGQPRRRPAAAGRRRGASGRAADRRGGAERDRRRRAPAAARAAQRTRVGAARPRRARPARRGRVLPRLPRRRRRQPVLSARARARDRAAGHRAAGGRGRTGRAARPRRGVRRDARAHRAPAAGLREACAGGRGARPRRRPARRRGAGRPRRRRGAAGGRRAGRRGHPPTQPAAQLHPPGARLGDLRGAPAGRALTGPRPRRRTALRCPGRGLAPAGGRAGPGCLDARAAPGRGRRRDAPRRADHGRPLPAPRPGRDGGRVAAAADLLELGRAELVAGAPAALEHLAPAAATALDDDIRVDATVLATRALLFAGRFDAAHATVQRALEHLGSDANPRHTLELETVRMQLLGSPAPRWTAEAHARLPSLLELAERSDGAGRPVFIQAGDPRGDPGGTRGARAGVHRACRGGRRLRRGSRFARRGTCAERARVRRSPRRRRRSCSTRCSPRARARRRC